ncbi:MAG: hypothetical protein PHU46_17035 [Rhodocyclaceae bacterium]|nr:hypothetical protein [Rhodocyclaceae bacterium]
MLATTANHDRIPHRFLMLRALRALRRGRPFVVLGSMSWDMMLDGIPFAPALFSYLLDHGWLEQFKPRDCFPGVFYFGLSEKGRGFLEKGESWWHSLDFWQKFQVALMG